MSEDFKRLSKTMAHALRHEPKQYGLDLDENGWTRLSSLIEGLRNSSGKWVDLNQEYIEAMIAAADKQRYEIEGDRIRAVYGHSSDDIEINYDPATPPEILFHGTTPQALELIRGSGLKPMKRKFVHLSPDIATANTVARRRTNNPQIIEVEALRAHNAGIQFYYGHDAVWLSGEIRAQYLKSD